MDDGVRAFSISIADSALEDLRLRLERARLPDMIPGTGWDYGVDVDYLRSLIGYWRDGYDWRAQEFSLNRVPQFTTSIDGQNFHFLHMRSQHPSATPLIMLHGWPGSIVEFMDVMGPLAEPEKYGGRAQDAFHVVAPSLPGFGFSGPPRDRGWNPRRAARALTALMARLGYGRYVAQGGDWGAIVADEMAVLDPVHMIGLHNTMPLAPAPADSPPLSPAEQADVALQVEFHAREDAYALLQGTKPQTIGAALNDSPAGLCGWIVEKFHAWTDCNGDLEAVIDRDRILTNVMTYWLTGTATSSARFYYEFFRTADGVFDPDMFHHLAPHIPVPTGIARFPREVVRLPRSWLERRYNLVHWSEMPRGGHFAALEQPGLLVDDLRAFVRGLRTR